MCLKFVAIQSGMTTELGCPRSQTGDTPELQTSPQQKG